MKLAKYILSLVLLLTVSIGFAQEKTEHENDPKSESVTKDSSKDIYLVAKASKNQVSVDEEIHVEYRLYVSPNIGISSWELIEKPIYEGFNYENVKLENLKIENVTYKGKSYRMVILKKDILQATKKGDYQIKPLQLQIVTEVADTTNKKEGFNLSMKQVTMTILSNALKIKVKS
nr:hypothetical protein [uncultured Psychroserpens sp.]